MSDVNRRMVRTALRDATRLARTARQGIIDQLNRIDAIVSALVDLRRREADFALEKWEKLLAQLTIAMPATRPAGEKKKTLVERMLWFFRERDNAPASNLEIRNAVGATAGAVRGVLYSNRRDNFELLPRRVNGKSVWRLTPGAWKKVWEESSGE